MSYCIVNKIEYIGGSVVYTPIKYIDNNEALCNQINNDYDTTLGAWIETNKTDLENSVVSISSYFDSTPIVYIARTISNNIDGLTQLNDISEL